MRTQQHPHNFIWLLLVVWLSVALPANLYIYSEDANVLNNTEQDTLRVYTDNDDVALEDQRELQERAEKIPLRLTSIFLLLNWQRDVMHIAFVIFCNFVPLRIYRYLRRRTRTPALPIHTACLN